NRWVIRPRQEDDYDEDKTFHNEINSVKDFDLMDRCRKQNKNISLPKQKKFSLLNSLNERPESPPQRSLRQKNNNEIDNFNSKFL
ncbi:unnamed protein product, partial [Brachionus calyciflorus]